MDNSYCLIRLNVNINISLYFFYVDNNVSQYPICITACQSDILYYLMSLHNSFRNLSINHYLYLGKELYKAELSLILKQKYIQD
nr:hypothetical protein [Cystoclonium purpureum f. stellatum]